MVNRRDAPNKPIAVKIYHRILTDLFASSALLLCFNNYRDRGQMIIQTLHIIILTVLRLSLPVKLCNTESQPLTTIM